MFLVSRGELEGRWDVYYYKIHFRQLVFSLENGIFPYIPLLKISSKITDGSHYSPTNDSSFEKKYVTVKDLDHFGNLNLEDCLTISNEEFAKLVRTGCQPAIGDVLFSKDGTVGKTFTVLKDNDFVTLSSLAIISPNQSSILPKYLEFILRADFVLILIKRVMGGSALQRIILQNISNLKIPVPPLEIQQQIVDKMEAAYTSKRTKEAEAAQLLASIDGYLLEQLGITLPESTPKKKTFFVNLDKVSGGRFDPFYHQDEFEQLEQKIKESRFTVTQLYKVLTFLESGSRPNGGVSNYEVGILSFGGEHINHKCQIEVNNTKFIPLEYHLKNLMTETQLLDILLVKDGATTGKIGIIEKEEHTNCNINEHVFLIRLDLSKSSPYFVLNLLASTFYQKIIKRIITGATVTGITKDVVKNIPIPIPPLAVQHEIAAHITAIRTQAQALEAEAKEVIALAKQEVEAMILGEGGSGV